ncbi:FAD/NAD(P)-binding protein [Silvanigrella aquatica]|uniref:FAD-dependent urate hydroxylase HpyO/Asp monooxygenase CreE-like FAD/NAD(P)-binding domain-containing protein n=1 Tax=Silvanigrella aquatica TaxID=1915309 RepID=A0A1L4D349_9BACT|nr:FAD/NAD(P)-binding protein [Silvanigrella aquatica]APJ04619.1 hypothetical protein AXG55_12180 [Silvanigrella aquatica]
MNENKYDIIIIGAGAQAISFLAGICSYIKKNDNHYNLKIGIIDKKENFGCGRVYNHDFPWILMNTPATDLSIDKNNRFEFYEWIKKTIDPSILLENNYDFVPRNVFGLYLKDKYIDFKNQLYNKGIILEDIIDYAKDISIDKNEKVDILLESKNNIKTNYVVFATGPSNSDDYYNLKICKNYIHNPLPANQKLINIPKDANVGIIGSNLTAIDVAVTLKHLGHTGNIFMASRNGKLPEVKGKYLKSYPPHNAQYLNFKKLSEHKKDSLSLKDLIRYIRKDLALHGYHWRNFFFEKNSKPESFEDFKCRVEEAQTSPTPFNIVLGIIPEIAKTWRLVSQDQIDLFMSNYYRQVHQKHGAIPLVNAEKILKLMETGQLLLKGNLTDVNFKNQQFNLNFKNQESLKCDFVINATGPKKTICQNVPKLPFTTLCASGNVNETHIGGIIIDINTGKILTKNGFYQNKLRAIGHNAEGSHPFINNFAWILETSFEVAESLFCEVINAKRTDGT